MLVAVLLAIEFVFVGNLLNLLNQAETEARNQEHFRQIIASTNRLIELNYVAVYAIRDFVSTKDTYHEKKYLRAIDEMKTNLESLETALKSEPYQLELIKRIRSKFNIAFNVADRARTVMEEGGSLAELAELMRSRGEFTQLNRQLIPDFQDLLRAQRRIEEKSPVLQRKWREQTRVLLTWGMILNVVIAIAMAAFFTRGIIKRLEVLIDNTKRLKNGEALRPALDGHDEIANLDRVFHDMAFELTEAARKEQMALSDAKEAEARIRQVISNMPTGVLSTDRSGTILFANPRVASTFQYSTSDLKGMHISKLLPALELRKGDDSGGMQRVYEELNERSIELRAKNSKGVDIDIDLSVNAFDSRGEKRFLVTLLDISEKLEVQRMRQAFVAMVSHELRTPLNSVQGYLELLEMGAFGELSEDAHKGAVRASANIERLIALIKDLLDLEKMESGTINLNIEKHSVNETVRCACDAVNDLAAKKKIEIEVNLPDDMVYDFDRDRIIQVLVNFLSNALKFTPEGGKIEITGRFEESARIKGREPVIEKSDRGTRQPALESETRHRALELSVIDQGPGVPERYRDVIFERFQQVNQSGHQGGTGLGLAICKAIVEQHHGAIGVDCEREVGSRFWFTL